MNRIRVSEMLVCASCLILFSSVGFAADPSFSRKQDVIYGRKFGTALTMDVFTPTKDAKGVGMIVVVSGGFISSHEAILPALIQPLTNRG
jgi:hypothetical protein